jgi:hypothetical protein
MIRATLKKASELLQKEARVAIPAAGRAAVHGAKEFLRRLPEEYAKERNKR